MTEFRVSLTTEPYAIEMVVDSGDERTRDVAGNFTLRDVANKLGFDPPHHQTWNYTIETDPLRQYEYSNSEAILLEIIAEARRKGYTLQDVANAIRDTWIEAHDSRYMSESAQAVGQVDSEGNLLRLPSPPDIMESPLRLQVGDQLFQLVRTGASSTIEEASRSLMQSRVADIQDIANSAIFEVRRQCQEEITSWRTQQRLTMPALSFWQMRGSGIMLSLWEQNSYMYHMAVEVRTNFVRSYNGRSLWKLKKPIKHKSLLGITTDKEGRFIGAYLFQPNTDNPLKHPHCFEDGKICYGSRSNFPSFPPDAQNLLSLLNAFRDETLFMLETLELRALVRNAISDVNHPYQPLLDTFHRTYPDPARCQALADIVEESQSSSAWGEENSQRW